MAKNEVKSSSSKNNSNNSNKNGSSTHKNIFIICAAIVIVLLVGLWIFSIKEKLPTTLLQGKEGIQSAQETQATQLEPEQKQADEKELVGMAIKGYVEPNPTTTIATQGYAVINPQAGTAYLDSADTNNNGLPDQIPFTVEVEAYPYVTGLTLTDDMKKVNNFKITLKYDSTKFEYKSAKVLPSGSWDTSSVGPTDIGQSYKQIIFEAWGKDPSTTYPYDSATTLAEFTFAPLTSTGTGIIQLADIDITNSLSNGGYIDIIAPHTQQYDKATISLEMKMYADVDGDNYGNPLYYDYYPYVSGDLLPTVQGKKLVANDGDCNDDITKDPTVTGFSCPSAPSSCTFINPDSLMTGSPTYTADYYNPDCAICQSPSTPKEICDGIDNNCNGEIDNTPDGTPQTCQQKGYECGVFYTCKGSHQLDCNNEGVSFSGKYAGHEKCADTNQPNPYCDVSTGNCVSQLGEVTVCPGCEDVETNLENCYESFPCDVTDCTNKGGVCSGSVCVISGTTCTDLGSTINLYNINGDVTNYAKKNCLVSDLLLAECQDASTLMLNQVTCSNGCDLNLGGCINGEVLFTCPDQATGETTPEKCQPPDVVTPGCGNSVCNTFETYTTCDIDCDPLTICVQNTPTWEYCAGTDTDGDSLPDAYENYLNTNAGKTWFDSTKDDTDGDGIIDSKDYCPGTDTKSGGATLATGRVNLLGCYAADVGSGNTKSVRPDGCFSGFDTTYYIGYYTNLMNNINPQTCTNLYGQPVTS